MILYVFTTKITSQKIGLLENGIKELSPKPCLKKYMCEKGKKLIKQKAFQTDFQINISV
jgi:hypothetical protein